MKYVTEFRDAALAKQIASNIAAEVNPNRSYALMEFCGGHTHAISRYGVIDLLPKNIQMVHGPGCPVCVLPMGRIENALQLALQEGVILCCYGDVMRVPVSDGMSLLKAQSAGGDVRMVYSASDALSLAQQHPERQVVFFAIGFETTTPPTAVVIQQAKALGLTNFSVFCNHVLTPAAIYHVLNSDTKIELDGVVGPAHVSCVIGSQAYAAVAEQYGIPVVIAGFEPLDVMQAILMLVRQVNEGRSAIENEFTRAVTPTGNLKAQQIVADVFEVRPSFLWRGLGQVPQSALAIREQYAEFDAEKRFQLADLQRADHKSCDCGEILRGLKRPQDCKLFGTVCTPDNPMGSCMVSSEGACAAHYRYGRFREQ